MSRSRARPDQPRILRPLYLRDGRRAGVSDLFFSQSDPRTALLLSLVSYGLAFVARPVGAAIFGHYGDPIGRKRVLFLTLLMMGVSTFLIGALQTYGVSASWLR